MKINIPAILLYGSLSLGFLPALALAQGEGIKAQQDYIQSTYYEPRYPGGKSPAESYADSQKVVEAAIRGESYSVITATASLATSGTITTTTVADEAISIKDEEKNLFLSFLIIFTVLLFGIILAGVLQKKETK